MFWVVGLVGLLALVLVPTCVLPWVELLVLLDCEWFFEAILEARFDVVHVVLQVISLGHISELRIPMEKLRSWYCGY